VGADAWQLLVGLALALLGGPLTGVWIVLGGGPESEAPRVASVVAAAFLSFLPLALWFRYRQSFWIALSIFLWLSAGYYFAIGMWV
jgi:hypothetical protein